MQRDLAVERLRAMAKALRRFAFHLDHIANELEREEQHQ